MHVINDKLLYAISGLFRRNTEIFKGTKKDACQRLIISAHDLTTLICFIFAAVLFTLIYDEKHMSWAH